MPKYLYTLIDETGKKISGSVFTSSKEVAQEKLKKKDQILLSLNEEEKIKTWFWQRPKLSLEDKMFFTKNLATMIKVGITITEAIEIIIDQTKENNNRRMYENILDMIKSGQTLAKSLKEYDYIFSDIFINMIATGEKSGTLDQILERLDSQLEKQYDLRKKVIGAFIYPAIIMGLTVLVTMGIMVFIMPKITKIFSSFDMQLPFLTRLIIGTSDFIVGKPLVTVLIFGSIILFFSTLLKIKQLKPLWQRIFIHVPVFGRLIVYANLANFSRTMNSLLQSGIPVAEAMNITSRMIDNLLYKKIIKEAQEKVEQGGRLGESLENHGKLFPAIATKLLTIGEKTGGLELTTERLANLYEENVDSITKNLSVLLEPILLVFMATLVGGIVLSIILPIYQLPNIMQK